MFKTIIIFIFSATFLTACGAESDKSVKIDKNEMWDLLLNQNDGDEPNYEEWLSNKKPSDDKFSRHIHNYYKYLDSEIDFSSTSDADELKELEKQLAADIKSGKSQFFRMTEHVLENNWSISGGEFNRLHMSMKINIQTAEIIKLCENGAKKSQPIEMQYKRKLGDVDVTSSIKKYGKLNCDGFIYMFISLGDQEGDDKDFMLSKFNKGESIIFSGSNWSTEIPGFPIKYDKKV